MGKKRTNASLVDIKEKREIEALVNNCKDDVVTKIRSKSNEGSIHLGKNEKDRNMFSSINDCVRKNGATCFIWFLIAIILLLINQLYLEYGSIANIYKLKDKSKSPPSLVYSNSFKSFQIINYEHVTFPQIENSESKQKSQLSNVNKNINDEKQKNHNIEIGNDFNMVIFHEEENNETKQGNSYK